MQAKFKNRWPRLVTLVVTSTFIAELLSGSTSLSRINQLLPQFIFYGTGAILVREVTRRLGLGWVTIILLGFAYGLIEEGLVLQSLFNPHFIGLDISFGRAAGVNWVWAEYLTGMHAFWSITGSILFCEVIFPEGRSGPWAGRPVIWVCGVLYVLICVAMHALFIRLFGFRAGAQESVITAVVVLVLIVLALNLPKPGRVSGEGGVFWVLGLVTLAAGVLWFLGIYMIMTPNKPALWVALGAGPVLLLVYFALLSGWRVMAVKTDMDRLAVAAGLLGADLILGYTGTESNKVDHYGQIGLILGTLAFLFVLYRRHAAKAAVVKS